MSKIQKSSSSSSSSSGSSTAPPQLVALPSLSCQLSSLPQAKSLDHLSLHHNSMSAQRAAESEAKVRLFILVLYPLACSSSPNQLAKVLSKTSSSHSAPFAPAYATPSGGYSPNNNSPPLMMRKPVSCALSARRVPSLTLCKAKKISA